MKIDQNRIKHQANVLWAYGLARGVSPGFWGACLATAALAVVCQVGLALSFIARTILQDVFGVSEGLDIAPWESALTWPPMLLCALFLVAFVSLWRIDAYRAAHLEFFRNNPDTRLHRAAFRKIAPRGGPEIISCILLLASVSWLVVASFVLPGTGVEFLPAFVLALVVPVLVVCMPMVKALDRYGPTLRRLLTRVSGKGLFHGKSALRQKYENLPSEEKSAVAEHARKLGLSIDDPSLMRAAVSDYRERTEKAQRQATALGKSTPPARSGSGRRF